VKYEYRRVILVRMK